MMKRAAVLELFLAALAVTILYRIVRAFLRLASGRKDRESPGKVLKDSETGRPVRRSPPGGSAPWKCLR